MLTPDEKRFIKYWEEQRKGGRTQYFLLYILAGSFISTIVITFVSMMFRLSFANVVIWIVGASLVLISIATVVSWNANEKKFKMIIRREVDEARLKEASQ